MQKWIVVCALFLFSACAYKPIIIYSKVKDNDILTGLRDSLPFSTINSILTHNVDLETATYLNANSDNGSIAIFMTKGNVYLEARTIAITADSITYSGVLYYNGKRDTMPFNVSYRPLGNRTIFSRTGERAYLVRISIEDDNKDEITFDLRKFQNLIIKDDVVDLITGEMRRMGGRTNKFIIVNDVTKPKLWLDSLWILDFICEKEYKEYVARCEIRERQKLIPDCKSSYKLGWTFKGLTYDVFCKCRDK